MGYRVKSFREVKQDSISLAAYIIDRSIDASLHRCIEHGASGNAQVYHLQAIELWSQLLGAPPNLKIEMFETTNKRSLTASKDKVITVSANRDLHRRLLVVSKREEINPREMLSYELCCVPVSLLHPDGTMCRTAKSSPMAISKTNTDSLVSLPVSSKITAVLIDAIVLIQMVKSVGNANFEEMADIYHEVTTRVLGQNNCNRVDLVFDQYRSLSIKEIVRQRGGEASSMEIKIQHQNTPVPKQWGRFMSNPKNKQNLANFFSHSLSVLCKRELQPHQQVV